MFDEVILAAGRSARLKGFGLEELGIAGDRTVETNEYLETRFPNILAAGDVAGPYQFTHVASHQAWFAAVNALFGSQLHGISGWAARAGACPSAGATPRKSNFQTSGYGTPPVDLLDKVDLSIG